MEGLSEGEGVGGEVSTISSTNRTSYDVPMTHVMLTIHGEVTTLLQRVQEWARLLQRAQG